MFDALSEKLEEAWRKLRGQDRITEGNIDEALRDVRRALLEADVNFQVVKEFIADVRDDALGAEVIKGVTPDQQFIKIVYDQLLKTMGEENVPLAESQVKGRPAVILMAGLQGTGKTTATAKLALYLHKNNKKALLAAADVYRPAAIDQLQTLGAQIQVPVFSEGAAADPVDIARHALDQAIAGRYDVLIVDTAGRLSIDEAMMAELERIKAAIAPDEILLVVDAMTGQEAANLTRAFHERLGITGAILTKLDGDTRGGAALSVRKISGQPIKFVGVGEKVEALQPFYPDRMASRILGMGDVLTLVEKAQEEIDFADAAKMEQQLLSGQFDFEDFIKQMRMVKSMGSLGGLLKLMPGMGKISDDQIRQGEVQLKKAEAMIGSMTKQERRSPDLINVSRKRRIARGSGVSLEDVGKLLNDFNRMRQMMKMMGGGGPFGGGMGGMGNMFGGGNNRRGPAPGPNPALGPGWRGQSSSKKSNPNKSKGKKKGKGFGG
ncbi:signal recognition particle protein [Gloeobacter kilaueensis]|uniref:Signal recognition particle protein n=1 Tax=Gloeobacter kilaueensis (strain ATCC BAA-2537 / CCAP 1431/1 / ULC 316 / JS1) TaxID=1183438 RepID=U5QH85_GLOK1|nr:signal recognition particle protein [Gloeobacter kilaueensis]AGY57020.1 signal recognition particle protein SRP54 [Gloeobacter kilaueensis JS1]